MESQLVENPNKDFKKLGELIKGIPTAMLGTVDSHGRLRSRPMMTQEAEFNGDLWFFSSKEIGKLEELERDSRVNVIYSDTRQNRFVSISGHAEMTQNQNKIEELWSPALFAWFPKGMTDPSIVLLKVHVEEAEYWDSPSSAMVTLIGFAKAVLI